MWFFLRRLLSGVIVRAGVSLLSSMIFGNSDHTSAICPSCEANERAEQSASSLRPVPYDAVETSEIKNYIDGLDLEAIGVSPSDFKNGYYSGYYEGRPASLQISGRREKGGAVYFDYIILSSSDNHDVYGTGKLAAGSLDFGMATQPHATLIKMRNRKTGYHLLFISASSSSFNKQFQFVYHERV